MSDEKVEFFTRETWRPSKKRKFTKRIKPWGGRKTIPPELVEAGKRTQFQPGHVNHRICTATKRNGAPCRMLALKGLTVCGAHGGFSICAQKGTHQHSPRSAAAKALRAAIPEARTNPPHQELAKLQAYKNANQRNRMRLIKAWNTPAWNGAISACV